MERKRPIRSEQKRIIRAWYRYFEEPTDEAWLTYLAQREGVLTERSDAPMMQYRKTEIDSWAE